MKLSERFESSVLDERLQWFCPPQRVRVEPAPGRLVIEPDAATDFWQRTHYGFRADNGHFLHLRATGNFVLTTRLSGAPRHQYDQAGLMLRVSPDCWLKTSVEFEPDEAHDRLGVVVTNHGYSDWSTQPLEKAQRELWFRIRAQTTAVIVESSFDGLAWQQLRMAHLAERTPAASLGCGVYACSPKGAGYRAEFYELTFEPTA